MNAASHRFRELSTELLPGVQNDPPGLAKIAMLMQQGRTTDTSYVSPEPCGLAGLTSKDSGWFLTVRSPNTAVIGSYDDNPFSCGLMALGSKRAYRAAPGVAS